MSIFWATLYIRHANHVNSKVGPGAKPRCESGGLPAEAEAF